MSIDHQNIVPISDDILTLIISKYICRYQWTTVGLISRQFQRATLLAFRSLKCLRIGDFFPDERIRPDNLSTKGSNTLEKFLKKISNCCISVQKVEGFDDLCVRLDKSHLIYLSLLESLRILNISGCILHITTFIYFMKKLNNLHTLNISALKCYVAEDESNPVGLSVISADNQQFVAFESLLFYCKSVGLHSKSPIVCRAVGTSRWSFINVQLISSLSVKQFDVKSSLMYRDFLTQCTNLDRLEFSPDQVKAVKVLSPVKHLDFLLKLSKLRILVFSNFHSYHYSRLIENEFINNFAWCRNLRVLILSDNAFVSNRVLESIVECCVNLESLELDVRRLDDLVLCRLVNLHNLRSLSLGSPVDDLWMDDDVVITDDFINCLPRFPSLEHLALFLNLDYVTSNCLKSLSFMQNVSEIHMRGNIVNDDLVIGWCHSLGHQLTALEIPQCPNVTDEAGTIIAECCPNLKNLNLKFSTITDVSLNAFASLCPLLEVFDAVQIQDGITESGIMILLRRCFHLKTIAFHARLLEKFPDDIHRQFEYRIKFSC